MLWVIFAAVKELFEYLSKPDILEMWVVTRPMSVKNDHTKHGIHIHWPELIVDLETMTDMRSVSHKCTFGVNYILIYVMCS